MAQTLLQAVNRVLRIGGIIRGDTDPIVNFSNLQHGATLNLAIIAIQSTLTDLMAYYSFPQERVSGTLTWVAGQREYDLASNFMAFWNDVPFFYDAVQNNLITEYGGGEKLLSRQIFDYKTQTGYPIAYYNDDGLTRKVGFYPVPTASENGRVLTYDYEKDAIPLVEGDSMPFIRDIETFKFCDLAAIRFNALFTQMPKEPGVVVERDPTYTTARADLLKLVTATKPSRKYGRSYSS